MKNQKLCEMKVSRHENETAKTIRDHLNNRLRDQIESNWEGFIQCFKSPFKRYKIDFHHVEFVYALKKLRFFSFFGSDYLTKSRLLHFPHFNVSEMESYIIYYKEKGGDGMDDINI